MADRAEELAVYREKISVLLEAMEPARRGRLLRKVAHALRQSQRQRIAAQVAPDGSPWPRRKPRKDQPAASRAIRFLYRKPGGDVRLADMRSWVRRGDLLTGFDREAEGIRTFRADRIQQHLPSEGGADPGALPAGIRGQKGGLKRKAGKMFARIGGARHLKAGAGPDEAWVMFTTRASRLARVHHFGLKDRVVPYGPETRYPQRQLLGFSQDDDEAIMAIVLEDLSGGL